jgi:hypothetical protein
MGVKLHVLLLLLLYSLHGGETFSFNLLALLHEKEPQTIAPIGNDYWYDQILE